MHKRVVEKTFQGEVQVTRLTKSAGAAVDDCYDMEKKDVKFFFLSLDLPSHPLFKEQ